MKENILISSVCICGAGTMGSGIAQVTAMAGYSTVLFDLNEAILQQAQQQLYTNLQKLVEKGKISEDDKLRTLQKITFTSSISKCKADLVIEAIIEKLDAKTALFRQLAAINPAHTILASNTSSLSITEIAAVVLHPERMLGIHFFNPAPLMQLVEIVTTPATNSKTIDTALHFIQSVKKTPVVCKDAPGFIVNRVARPYYIEALRLAEKGVASYETIDKLLEAQGFKMGPFKLMDLIGNDVNYAVSCSVYEQLAQPERLRPSYLQKEKVEKGELGKKSGKGYYSY